MYSYIGWVLLWRSFVSGGFFVTKAWRVLGLQMQGRPPDMEGSYKYVE